jgi:WD40 repeat protein/serine/threonine protein kinase
MSEEEIFHQALTCHNPVERAEFLAQACAGDEARRVAIEVLLRANEGASGFLTPPAGGATVEMPSVSERPGVMIGPYKLLEQIGEGGFGVVFMAEQMRPVRRKVALKVLKPGMDTRQVVARFEAERQALAIMDHPHIAKVFDGGATRSGRPYFVMELVKGVPITEFCDQNHLTPRQRLEMFVPVCQAVQHAHQKDIIHRDLKPSNVLVSRHDTTPIVKIIDFGVAKALGQDLTDKTLFTGLAQMIGTPLYMSPEQAGMSDLDVDTRSDIYALGVLLYELLTGTTPFEKHRFKTASYDEIRRIIREEEPPRPSTRLSDLGRSLASKETSFVPGSTQIAKPATSLATVSTLQRNESATLTKLVRGELDWIVMKALEKDRRRRYETANGLAMDVQRYLRDEPVEACPPSALYRLRKLARRHRALLATVGAMTLVVFAAAGMLALSNVRVSKALLRETEAKSNLSKAFDQQRDDLERERRNSYQQRMALAEREWSVNNLSRMEALLTQCPADLRGWEWRYLRRLRYGATLPLRHESSVYSVVFSPDGQYLATATKDGLVRLLRAKTHVELAKWPAHEANATCIEFSPDSRYLASGGWDSRVKVWDVEKIRQSKLPAPLLSLEHTNRIRVWGVAFRSDGQRLATVGGRDEDEKGEAKVWDLRTRQEVLTLSNFSSSVRCVRFTPDGRRFITCAGETLQVWDAQSGRQELAWHGDQALVEEFALSRDGRWIASVGGPLTVYPDQEVKVWDVRTGQVSLQLHGHVGGLRAVAFSPDSRRLASAGLDQTIKIWDVVTGEDVLTLRGHIDNIFGLAFSPDGHQLVSSSLDNTVRIWDATPLEMEPTPETRILRVPAGAVTDVAFHPTDGRSLVSADTTGMAQVWDVLRGEKMGALYGASSATNVRVAFSPDGQRLAMVSQGQG